MATRVAYLEAVFGADITAFRRGTSQVRRELGLLSETAGGLSRVGRNMTLMLTAPLLAVGGAAAKVATDFDASMRNVNSILFNSEAQFKTLKQEMLAFGSSIRSGPQAAAEALYTVVSAGFTELAGAKQIAEVATATAEAGLANLNQTTETLTAVILSYGAKTREEFDHISDVITRTVQVGVGEMDQFSTGFANVVPSAVALGVSFQEVGATMAFMTQRGKEARTAGTELNMVMTALFKPTEAMKSALQKLGVSSGRELITKFGSLKAALEALSGSVGGSQEDLAKLFGRIQAMRGVNTLANDFDAVTAAFEEFGIAVEGATGRAREEQMKSYAAQMDKLGSVIQGIGISVGDKLLPLLMPFVNGLEKALQAFIYLDPAIVSFGIAVAAAAAAVGPFLWVLSSLLTPVGLLTGAIAGLGAAIAIDIGGARHTFMNFINDITGGLGPLMAGIDEFYNVFTDPMDLPDYSIDPDAFKDSGIEFAISKELGTLWDVWATHGEEWGYDTFDAFQTALNESMGKDINPYTLHIGDVFQIGDVTDSDRMALGEDLLRKGVVPDDIVDKSFGGRLQRAIDEAWPKIETALNTIKLNIGNWFTTDFLPSFDGWGTQLITAITRVFDPTAGVDLGGDTWGKGLIESMEPPEASTLTDRIKNWIANDILGGLNNAGDAVVEALPGISGSIGTMFRAIGQWIVDTGIPNLSYFAGYLAGSVSGLIVTAIKNIDLTGAGGLKSALDDSVFTPFSEGFGAAKSDMGLTGMDSFAADIAGALMLSVPLILPILTKLGFGGAVASAVWGALKGVFAGSAATSAAATGFSAAAGSAIGLNIISGFFVSNFKLGLASTLAKFSVGGTFLGTIATSIASSVSSFAWGAYGIALKVATALGGFLGAALPVVGIGLVTIGVAKWMLDSETGKRIQNFAKDSIIDPIFGEGSYNEMNKSVEFTLAQFVFSVAEFVGAEDFSNSIGQAYGLIATPEEEADPMNLTGQHSILTSKTREAAQIAGQELADEYLSGTDLAFTESVGTTEMELYFGPDGRLHGNLMTLMSDGTVFKSDILGLNEDLGDVKGNQDAINTAAALHAADMRDVYGIAMDPLLTDLRAVEQMLDQLADVRVIIYSLVEGGPSIQGHAKGGNVFPGSTSIVGENGPELLRMGSMGGNIVSNHEMRKMAGSGGGTTNQITINGVQDVDAMISELRRRGIYLE